VLKLIDYLVRYKACVLKLAWLCIFSWSCAVYVPSAQATVVLPAVFADDMVIQRDRPITIWGQAAPSERISLQFARQSVQTIAGKDGSWVVELKPMPAGGPYKLSVKGSNVLTVSNVLLGDVWLCGGQSNMSIKIKYSDYNQRDLARANLPNVRYFKVEKILSPKEITSAKGTWAVFSSQWAPEIPAVQFHFATDVFNRVHVPIGLIDLSYGGAPIECFLEDVPLARAASESGRFFPSASRNGMVLPVSKLRAKGVLWYQGESNCFEARRYADLLTKLIDDWRGLFRSRDMPFFIVQLPNCGKRLELPPMKSDWAELREAQALCSKLPHVFMTVNIDTNPDSPAEIHSRFKRLIGQRLAELVLANVYGYKLPRKYPTLLSLSQAKNEYFLTFGDVGRGLGPRQQTIKGFAVAGDNRVFMPAQARLGSHGNDVVVCASAGPVPKALRYAWADNPECNLCSSNRLPVSPFRTDHW